MKDQSLILKARHHLQRQDPVMKALMDRIGPYRLVPVHRPLEMLVRSIISQQISTAAARNIRARVQALSSTGRLSLSGLEYVTDEQFRAAGLSPQKLKYLRDLFEHCQDGRLKLSRLSRMSDERVIEELTQVKGIGVWTAQMFLMFCLGRPDILPHGDLGIQNAVKSLYGWEETAGISRVEHFEQSTLSWRPYATMACWYSWRSLEFRTPPQSKSSQEPV